MSHPYVPFVSYSEATFSHRLEVNPIPSVPSVNFYVRPDRCNRILRNRFCNNGHLLLALGILGRHLLHYVFSGRHTYYYIFTPNYLLTDPLLTRSWRLRYRFRSLHYSERVQLRG